MTKVGARRDDAGGWLPALAPHELRAGVEDNLRSLQVERMDLVNLRAAWRRRHGPTSRWPSSSASWRTCASEGKLDLIGVSNVTLEAGRAGARSSSTSPRSRTRSASSTASTSRSSSCCREHDIAFVPFFPLGSAFTGGPAKLAADPAIAGVAEKHGATPTQIALAWLLAPLRPDAADPRARRSVAHLEENMAAGDVELDAEDLSALA